MKTTTLAAPSSQTDTPTRFLAVLPYFPGFYESILDSLMDQEMEQRMDEENLTWEQADELCDYGAARLAISKGWVNAFNSELDLSLELESIGSPKEYNFTTDRLYVYVTPEDLAKVFSIAGGTSEFREVLAEWFTSRSGFISFYSNNPENEEWQKPIEEWDPNQISALLAAFVYMETGKDEGDFQDSLYDRPCVYEAAQYIWKA